MCEKWPFFEIFTRFAVNVCGSRYGCRRYFCAFVGSRALVCKVKSFSKKNCCSDFVPFVATCKMYPFEFIGSLQSFDCWLGGGHTPGQDTVFLPSFRFFTHIGGIINHPKTIPEPHVLVRFHQWCRFSRRHLFQVIPSSLD